MIHKAWSSIEEMHFWGSSVKFLGHTAKKIVDFDPNWAFPDCNSNLNSAIKSLRFALFTFRWSDHFIQNGQQYFSRHYGISKSYQCGSLQCVSLWFSQSYDNVILFHKDSLRPFQYQIWCCFIKSPEVIRHEIAVWSFLITKKFGWYFVTKICPLLEYHADGLMQERCNSIANALGLHLSCINLWIYQYEGWHGITYLHRYSIQYQILYTVHYHSTHFLLNTHRLP